jgi:2-oxoglutarate ferredoxin oxidoreductase subunit gamma
VDILVAMSQAALDRYVKRLRPGGTLVIDPQFVKRPQKVDARVLEVPVTRIATDDLGQTIVANMVLLGFLRQATGIVPEAALLEAIRESVPERFCDTNLEAAARGKALAVEQKIAVEV